MQKARDQFDENMRYVRELGILYDYLKNTLRLPNDLSDILRSQLVYSVSALDKFIHELIRIGMLQSFLGLKPKTDKFNNFTISMSTLEKIQEEMRTSSVLSSTPPSSVLSSTPPHFWLEQEIILKNKTASFQEPAKIADGLSFIWTENRKWTKIAAIVGEPEEDLKKMLKNIVDRRNKIVHEADLDPNTETKLDIEATDVLIQVELIDKIAKAIYGLVC